MQTLSIGQVVAKGIWQQRWMQIPIALGVAAATAIIVGALIVGDSVRISLRDLALDRLGKTDYLLMSPRFFHETTVKKWGGKNEGHAHSESKTVFPLEPSARIEGAILFPRSTIEKRSLEKTTDSRSANQKTISHTQTAGGVLCFGIDESFWGLGSIATPPALDDETAILNSALADELSISVGDRVTIRLPSLQAVPADSPLGKRDESTLSLPNLRVIAILPNESLARFDLRSNQRPARNIFVSKSVIQSALDRPNHINAAFISGSVSGAMKQIGSTDLEVAKATSSLLLNSLPISLVDLGYSIKPVARSFSKPSKEGEVNEATSSSEPSESIIDYLQITSDQLLIPNDALSAIESSFSAKATGDKPKRASLMAYLANAITKVDSTDRQASSTDESERTVPYSTIVGIEPQSIETPSIGFNKAGTSDQLKQWMQSLEQGELLITDWLATQTDSKIGDTLRIHYYAPENVEGAEVEKHVDMRIGGVVTLTKPATGYRRNKEAKFDTPPTQFNDPEMVPKVPGITDQESMSDWDLPFTLTRKIRPIDDEYWNQHRLTPKLYMSLKESQRLFGSRFGNVSSIRVANRSTANTLLGNEITDADENTNAERSYLDDLNARLLSSLGEVRGKLGWQVLPLRAQQLAASKGTTPFDALFLALSMFVIISALLLVSLLFRLSIERRATTWGLLKSIGFPQKRIQLLLRTEGLILSAFGAMIGVGMGIAYGYTVIELLKSWWIGAVGTPFLDFHVNAKSLIFGGMIGIAMAWLTILFSARFISRQSPIQLLKGIALEPVERIGRASQSSLLKDLVTKMYWILPAGILITGLWLTGPAAAGAFVGGGMLMLLGLVTYSHRYISRRQVNPPTKANPITLASLAKNSVRRNPWRSVLAIGLMAVATFLILSISLFEASPDEAGTGGFDLMVQSTVAIPKNLADESYQREVLGDRAEVLGSTTIIPMRVRDGDDAGCSNLYQASQPQILGVSRRLGAAEETDSSTVNSNSKPKFRSDFAWAAKGAIADENSPWGLLETGRDGTAESPIPVILDQNTALWALHLTGMTGEEFHFEFGDRTIHFKTVAVLQNTILQGSLLISEGNFEKLFPEISGYRAWLIRDDAAHADALELDAKSHILSKLSETLESGWSDEGMDASTTESILKNLLAVQNTYLKAFQSLGGLGLLLGTLGLTVVQMRSIQERRPELGLMKAMGWSESRLGKLLLMESITLLFWGIGIGLISAFFAILPTLIQGSTPVGVIAPAITMAAILVFGLISAFVAVRSGVRVTMLNALHSE